MKITIREREREKNQQQKLIKMNQRTLKFFFYEQNLILI